MWCVWCDVYVCLLCKIGMVKSMKSHKCKRVKIHRLTKPEMLLRRFFPARPLLGSFIQFLHSCAFPFSHCKGHNLCMFEMMCVCWKMLKFPSARFFIIFFFRCKSGKRRNSTCIETTTTAKSALYMWSTQTQDETKKYPFHFLMNRIESIPLQSKHRCYCSDRWFWSSTLHRGINNKRHNSLGRIENQGTLWRSEKKGENSIKKMTKWTKLVEWYSRLGRSWKIDLVSWWIFFLGNLFKNQMQKIWKFQCV